MRALVADCVLIILYLITNIESEGFRVSLVKDLLFRSLTLGNI